MAQWIHQYSGLSHSSRVEQRRATLAAAIEAWNGLHCQKVDPDQSVEDQIECLRNKLLRLASDLQAAIIKEQTALLSRNLDNRSAAYQRLATKIADLRAITPEDLLRSHGAMRW